MEELWKESADLKKRLKHKKAKIKVQESLQKDLATSWRDLTFFLKMEPEGLAQKNLIKE
jgi:hypothetical protein